MKCDSCGERLVFGGVVECEPETTIEQFMAAATAAVTQGGIDLHLKGDVEVNFPDFATEKPTAPSEINFVGSVTDWVRAEEMDNAMLRAWGIKPWEEK